MQSDRGATIDDEIESSTDPEDEETNAEQDLDETHANSTVQPVPGFVEVVGDLFQ